MSSSKIIFKKQFNQRIYNNLNIIKNIFLGSRFYWVIGGLSLLYLLSYFLPAFGVIAEFSTAALVLFILLDTFLLFREKDPVFARREVPERLSNGDENVINVWLENRYIFRIRATVIDELPAQLQVRDFSHMLSLENGERKQFSYTIRPVTRGEYQFGKLNIYVASPIQLILRRFQIPEEIAVPVYPSFIQMRKYELLAISNHLSEAGIKKIRRVGHTLEFDQIREYVTGDDYRTINWKATARRRTFMVNHYQDEKSQQIYSVIDKGRVMKMPFDGMSLLDYAINASLVISNIALNKQDKAGIITFANTVDSIVTADRKQGQVSRIMDVLYNQTTRHLESDYARLFALILQKINRRSLILLFTNFETLNALRRQLPFLRKIAKKHLLVVIFFENTELSGLTGQPAQKLETVYLKTIAEQFIFEKKQIVKELQRYGIYAVLTPPENLSVNTINQYLYLKARGFI